MQQVLVSDLEGVGIDVEDVAAFDRFDPLAIARAGARWLYREERTWCERQPSPAGALLVVLCCREAAFKSVRGMRPMHELELHLVGEVPAGGGACGGPGRIEIEVAWRVSGGQVLALAAAGDRGAPGRTIDRLLRHQRDPSSRLDFTGTVGGRGDSCKKSS